MEASKSKEISPANRELQTTKLEGAKRDFEKYLSGLSEKGLVVEKVNDDQWKIDAKGAEGKALYIKVCPPKVKDSVVGQVGFEVSLSKITESEKGISLRDVNSASNNSTQVKDIRKLLQNEFAEIEKSAKGIVASADKNLPALPKPIEIYPKGTQVVDQTVVNALNAAFVNNKQLKMEELIGKSLMKLIELDPNFKQSVTERLDKKEELSIPWIFKEMAKSGVLIDKSAFDAKT
ncbi:MAG: hypothetical protein KBC84_08510, partial [Proteobacteria bacterium]|nr:hypothetical protein [Pseudomonadota bacterium]